MEIKWTISVAICIAVDAILVIWLLYNFLNLYFVGPLLIAFWIISLVLGIKSGKDLKKYDFMTMSEGPSISERLLKIIGCISPFIALVLGLLTVQTLELHTYFPETLVYTFSLGAGILLSPYTFNALGLIIAHPNRKKLGEISSLDISPSGE